MDENDNLKPRYVSTRRCGPCLRGVLLAYDQALKDATQKVQVQGLTPEQIFMTAGTQIPMGDFIAVAGLAQFTANVKRFRAIVGQIV